MPREDRLPSIEVQGFDEELLVERVQGTEEISRLFEFELDLSSEEQEIRFGSIVGKRATLSLGLKEGDETREIHGMISNFGHERVPRAEWNALRLFHYRAIFVPELWALTRTRRSRIFQNKNVVEILDEVCREHQVDLAWQYTRRELPAREYCVQYDETDFAFFSRLLEDEGLFYCFGTTQSGSPACIIADSEQQAECRSAHGHVRRLSMREEIRSNRYAVGDYDFSRPDSVDWSGEIYRSSDAQRAHGSGTREIYDYPVGYEKLGVDSSDVALLRLEEEEAQITVVSGEGDSWHLSSGHVFNLGEWDHEDLNEKQFRITSVRHRLRQPQREGGEDGRGDTSALYENWFECVPAGLPYRPKRVTPKPVMRGPQTAIVIGQTEKRNGGVGARNATDAYGRVQVKFPWSRDGKASCWIRVSQAWAGKTWGAMQIPHAGQEVIVDFLDGDPDRPIITGRVYNAKNKLPELEKDRHPFRTVLRDEFGHEFILDATPGDQHILLHSPHDEKIVVENDKSEQVGHDETTSVGHDREQTVGHDEALRVENDQDLFVGKDQTFQIGHNTSLTVGHQIRLDVGQASLTMKQDGAIILNGVEVFVTGKHLILRGTETFQYDSDEITGIALSSHQIKGATLKHNS